MKYILPILLIVWNFSFAQLTDNPKHIAFYKNQVQTANKQFHYKRLRINFKEAHQLLKLVNETRTEGCYCGGVFQPPAPKLKWSYRLSLIAKAHSVDMLHRDYLDYYTPEGGNLVQRVKKAGIGRISLPMVGENIASGYPSAEEVLKGWISSPGHCKNIMDPQFKWMGSGRADEVWTQVFSSHVGIVKELWIERRKFVAGMQGLILYAVSTN
jgi:uncharacterized protein YkwD